MKVKLKIKTTELDNQTIHSEIHAIKKIKENFISYKYIDEFGRTELEIYSDSIFINRFGKINSSLILKKDLKTSFNYETNSFNCKFDISTKNLTIDQNGFKCSYSIFQEKSLINNISISIHET
ncbi:DUF1934 family protein [Fusobacterium sp. IOR10]|uniref:DUF1934 family protein n=1 Tax=Fusobacterium sp. IOR10 TaxID=2665157 RepID=UPI0013D87594|nr:DUF1934 family protein [Fusobacterium sp. IOR10]